MSSRLGVIVAARERPRLATHGDAAELSLGGVVSQREAASLMVAAGVPIFDVAKILGHSTIAVTMRYAHFAPAAGRGAIDALYRQLRPAGNLPGGSPTARSTTAWTRAVAVRGCAPAG